MEELALYILDLVENALRAGATLVQIDINENPSANEYSLTIADDGAGIAKENLDKASDPFFTTRTTRKIGLGLSMIKQMAEMTNGTYSLESEEGTGTIIRAVFELNHIDRPEMGDIEGTIALLIASHPKMDYVYNHTTPQGTFNMDTRDIKKLFVSSELGMPAVRHSIKGYIRDNLNMIKASL